MTSGPMRMTYSSQAKVIEAHAFRKHDVHSFSLWHVMLLISIGNRDLGHSMDPKSKFLDLIWENKKGRRLSLAVWFLMRKESSAGVYWKQRTLGAWIGAVGHCYLAFNEKPRRPEFYSVGYGGRIFQGLVCWTRSCCIRGRTLRTVAGRVLPEVAFGWFPSVIKTLYSLRGILTCCFRYNIVPYMAEFSSNF